VKYKGKSTITYSSLFRHIIVCPADKSTTAATAFSTDAPTLVVDKFVIPWYLPSGALNENLGYVWTNHNGAVAGY
jgi:hypothetical protein